MKDEEGFYYPHNLDFRGRAYPMHPYLNHLGSDLCRGVLEFAEGRPLGESGLRWLKIHLANLYAGGVDKLSYDGRIAFAESHLEEIFDSADRPLEGKRWWLGAEDPFQCLAVCMNLTEALRSSSPETTISHIPVHQVYIGLVWFNANASPTKNRHAHVILVSIWFNAQALASQRPHAGIAAHAIHFCARALASQGRPISSPIFWCARSWHGNARQNPNAPYIH